MKRNRKAEARKRQHDAARQAAEQQHVSALLHEMETTAGRVLVEQFAFTPVQAHEFKLLLRPHYPDIRANLPRLSTEHDRLSIIARRFGLAGMQILKQHCGFTPEQNDRWLKAMIAYGKSRPVATNAQGGRTVQKQTNVTELEENYV